VGRTREIYTTSHDGPICKCLGPCESGGGAVLYIDPLAGARREGGHTHCRLPAFASNAALSADTRRPSQAFGVSWPLRGPSVAGIARPAFRFHLGGPLHHCTPGALDENAAGQGTATHRE
jgi:hypothetical protein